VLIQHLIAGKMYLLAEHMVYLT